MKNKIWKYVEVVALHQKTKEELVELVMELQERDKILFQQYLDLGESSRNKDKQHQRELEKYQKQLDKYMEIYATSEVEKKNYKQIADLKLGKTYNVNATWIDKIVFVLKAAGRPLRSSEIIEILLKNDNTIISLTDIQRKLPPNLTKALKYGRIIGEKQKGQNGYLFRLP